MGLSPEFLCYSEPFELKIVLQVSPFSGTNLLNGQNICKCLLRAFESITIAHSFLHKLLQFTEDLPFT